MTETQCSNCGVKTTAQPVGDMCHSCLAGVMFATVGAVFKKPSTGREPPLYVLNIEGKMYHLVRPELTDDECDALLRLQIDSDADRMPEFVRQHHHEAIRKWYSKLNMGEL